MKYRISAGLIFAVLTSILAMAQDTRVNNVDTVTEQTLTGTVTCTWRVTHLYHCGKNQTLESCTLACAEQGSPFALLVGEKSYVLNGNSRDLARYAGGKATVTGVLVRNTADYSLTVRSIAAPARRSLVSQAVAGQ